MSELMLYDLISKLNQLLSTNYRATAFGSFKFSLIIRICADVFVKLNVYTDDHICLHFENFVPRVLKVFENINIYGELSLSKREFLNAFLHEKRSMLLNALLWILSNQAEVKKRAYFTKYLKTVFVPRSFVFDPDVQELITQYLNLIREIRSVHAENTKYVKMYDKIIEFEKEIDKVTNTLIKLIDDIVQVKIHFESPIFVPNTNTELIKSLQQRSQESSRQQNLNNIIKKLVVNITSIESDIKKFNKILQKKQLLRTNKNVIINVQDEVEKLFIIIRDQLPQEYDFTKKQAEIVEIVAAETQPDKDELAVLQCSVVRLTLLIQNLTTLGQQAEVSANNKQIAANSMKELKKTRSNILCEIKEKECELQQTIGATMPQGEELQSFIRNLVAQRVIYRNRKVHLIKARTELYFLSRTYEKEVHEKVVPDNVPALGEACKDLVMQINKQNAKTVLLRQHLQKRKLYNTYLLRMSAHYEAVHKSTVIYLISNIDKTKEDIIKRIEQTRVVQNQLQSITRDIERKENILEKLQADIQFGSGNKSTVDIIKDQIREQQEIKGLLKEEMMIIMAKKKG